MFKARIWLKREGGRWALDFYAGAWSLSRPVWRTATSPLVRRLTCVFVSG